MHIDHINITAPPDLLRRTRDFYCDVLGLEEGYRPGFNVPGYWLYSDEVAIIHLVESGQDESSETGKGTGFLDHVAFRTADPDPILERLDARGVAYSIHTVPGSETRQVFLEDPAGTRLEITFDL